MVNMKINYANMPRPKRNKALGDPRVVHQLLDTHVDLQMQQAVRQTAMQFGISESEVLSALNRGNFNVRLR